MVFGPPNLTFTPIINLKTPRRGHFIKSKAIKGSPGKVSQNIARRVLRSVATSSACQLVLGRREQHHTCLAGAKGRYALAVSCVRPAHGFMAIRRGLQAPTPFGPEFGQSKKLRRAPGRGSSAVDRLAMVTSKPYTSHL